jgi:predicted O-methyltransferase YrrM
VAIDSRTVLDASQAVNMLARAYERAGEKDRAEHLFQVAADLELDSPELQDCWGGPLNGQAGRQAIVLDLIERLDPIAILETGTFRGISVEWLARNYRGPILSCEKEKLYFLQAQGRLSSFGNVDLRLEDSRQFLQEVLKTLPADKCIFIYLDAHWERDLPLREELTTIFATHLKAVVMIDDFRVPDDPGYGWDDYGPQGSVDLTLLHSIIPTDARLFFPKLPSDDETGARRGCCIIASKSAKIVALCHLIRGGTPEQWLKVQQAMPTSGPKDEESSGGHPDGTPDASYPNVIRTLERRAEALHAEVSDLSADRVARLKEIERLDAQVGDLQRRLEGSETDRAARLEVIERLDAEVRDLQGQLVAS